MSDSTHTHAGLYIHIPFCTNKCAYCDFYSLTDLSLEKAFMDAVIREMALLKDSALLFDTIYLGGGTPSVLPPFRINRLIDGAFSHFEFRDDVEITIEVNPGTINLNDLREYRISGINRINIGVQSFSDDSLAFLGRIHTADEAVAAIAAARNAGFGNLGIDLIYGLPGQSPKAWQSDLERAIGLSPEHLSCYTLTYEPGTPLEEMKADGQVVPLNNGTVADLFKIMQSVLDEHGYEQYEIANFARLSANTGHSYRSRHNQKYWTSAPYIGLGPSAHSFVEPQRRWNAADIQTYLARLKQGLLPTDTSENLTPEQRLTETLYLELRTVEGIDIPRMEQTFGFDFKGRYGNTLNDLMQEELIKLIETRCVLTRKGMRFLDGVVDRLISQETEDGTTED